MIMIFERIRSEGLALLSYFIGSGGEAAVIDPRRDVDVYLDIARKNNLRIKYALETHRNEDYVTGSLELRAKTGCEIYHGKGLPFKYGTGISGGEELGIGDLKVRVLATPGHTPESMTYVLYDAGGSPAMAFPGDSLFPGTTGRTDLWGGPGEAAGALYDSIMKKILPLGDGVLLCPAHGAGSVCGTGIADRDDSTLGNEKRTNPDLRLTKEEFIRKKAGEHPERPRYFQKMEEYNLNGPPVTGGPSKCLPISPDELKKAMGESILIDTRMPEAFSAHIPGSYSIWLGGLATWPGRIADYERPIYLLTERDEDVETASVYLYRLGFDKIPGYLGGGFLTWTASGSDVEFAGLLVPDALAGLLSAEKVTVLDVRSDGEWVGGRIKEAIHVFVGELERRIGDVPRGKPVACICSTGLRASLAASILQKAGYSEVYNVLGGITAWKARDYPLLYERLLER
jgi:hydroxyacylglutathione hydrolase